MYSILFTVSVLCVSAVVGDVSHILNTDPYRAPNDQHHYATDATTSSTPAPPPRPYVFSYTAGRAPGHVDRKHTEVSDGSGTVRGSFSYVDPRQVLRTVQYVADENGFHPQLSHGPEESEAVRRATAKHLALYNKIAESHNNPEVNSVSAPAAPIDTEAVAHAKNKHYNLFDQITEDHARIAAEREAQRLAFEATSEANQLQGDEHKHY